MPTVNRWIPRLCCEPLGDARHRHRGGCHGCGALDGAVAGTIAQHRGIKVKILSVPELASTGSAGYLLDRYGICPEGIAETARTLIK
jgi:hypothetical protein